METFKSLPERNQLSILTRISKKLISPEYFKLRGISKDLLLKTHNAYITNSDINYIIAGHGTILQIAMKLGENSCLRDLVKITNINDRTKIDCIDLLEEFIIQNNNFAPYIESTCIILTAFKELVNDKHLSVFFDKTWKIIFQEKKHPGVCALVSELYESKRIFQYGAGFKYYNMHSYSLIANLISKFTPLAEKMIFSDDNIYSLAKNSPNCIQSEIDKYINTANNINVSPFAHIVYALGQFSAKSLPEVYLFFSLVNDAQIYQYVDQYNKNIALRKYKINPQHILLSDLELQMIGLTNNHQTNEIDKLVITFPDINLHGLQNDSILLWAKKYFWYKLCIKRFVGNLPGTFTTINIKLIFWLIKIINHIQNPQQDSFEHTGNFDCLIIDVLKNIISFLACKTGCHCRIPAKYDDSPYALSLDMMKS